MTREAAPRAAAVSDPDLMAREAAARAPAVSYPYLMAREAAARAAAISYPYLMTREAAARAAAVSPAQSEPGLLESKPWDTLCRVLCLKISNLSRLTIFY